MALDLRANIRCGLTTILVMLVASALASGQESATLSVQDIVRAGETVNLKLTLDPPPNFEGGMVEVGINGPSKPGLGTLIGRFAARQGQRVTIVSIDIPITAPGGVWTVNHLIFLNGPIVRQLS